MAELERERDDLQLGAMDSRLYYDYEGRFIKQRLERDHMRVLPRVIKPAMFRHSGHALGDVRVFERFTVGPVSALTCRFLQLGSEDKTPSARRIPPVFAYCFEGSGSLSLEGESPHQFEAGDVAVVPPYTRFEFVAGPGGFRAWIPETRLWHVLGLLRHEHFEEQDLVGGVEPLYDGNGVWNGYRLEKGLLGLENETVLPAGPDPRTSGVFAARRSVTDFDSDGSWYDELAQQLVIDNQRVDDTPRVIRGTDLPIESTRGGRMRFYVDNWSNVAGQDVDMAEYEILPGETTGTHRHIAEELLLVLEGTGYDEHDGTKHEWEAGDLICIPPMTAHKHGNSGSVPARLVAVWTHHPANEYLGGFEHIDDASDWSDVDG